VGIRAFAPLRSNAHTNDSFTGSGARQSLQRVKGWKFSLKVVRDECKDITAEHSQSNICHHKLTRARMKELKPEPSQSSVSHRIPSRTIKKEPSTVFKKTECYIRHFITLSLFEGMRPPRNLDREFF